MKAELCKTCIHTKVCFKDKNLFGDVFISGNPMIFDNVELFEKFKKREAEGFPCDDYMAAKISGIRHGRWIKDEFGSKCGACGLYAYRDKFDKPWESPYCPICGAKMDLNEQ